MMRKNILLIISIILLWNIVVTIYFVNNFNKFIIYEFNGNDRLFAVSGNATFSKQFQVLNIMGVRYSGPDLMVKKIKLSIFANIDDEERLIYAENIESDDCFSLNEYLNTYAKTISEFYEYGEKFNNKIINNFEDAIYFKIEITDIDNNNMETVIKLESNRYSNNKIIYKK